ncbi:S8 family serine peptidase [Streptomyces sp. BE133]|uniref:S8 family serine peptidase n=1 Tax=Streptomyces sp. BE133 TaxID=3002523 RepID=UPI002E799DAD|nr:S8 family serine peptidase [Streptomyces sp. BE133]MEE1809590.1 S8 family serine peptidase [Streptomyces sp. BE133]
MALLLVGTSATTGSAATVLSRQWHLGAMQAETMWRTSTGEGVTVAVIDTGVREVPELAGQLLEGKDFTDGVTGEHDEAGTTAAAVIAGTGKGAGGKESAYGLAPGAKILPLKVSDGSEAPQSGERSIAINSDLAPAIRYAADSEAKVISISVTASLSIGGAVDEAVKYALSKGKLVFAAVGDSEFPERPVQNPAAIPGVTGVAALGKDLAALKSSAVGPEVTLSAAGEDVLSACAEPEGLCTSSGTAVATAVAAASAALIWAKHPDWTNYQVLRVMVNTVGGPTSGAVRNNYIGYGGVRPRIALKTPGDPGPADVYPLPDLTETPAAQPGGGGGAGTTPVAATTTEGRNTAFLVSLGVCAAGLLCLAVAVPLLLTDRRRTRSGLSRP